ncbi:MAG: hypothetical protein IPM64_18065 [Phycisphaerales bacterium]|nr:hypothetical protein [Phycisphaerales bacterium]
MAQLVRSREQAAEQLGVTGPALSQWKRQPWWPAGGHVPGQGWDVAGIRAARDAMGRKGSETSSQAAALKLATDTETLKHERLKTRLQEIKVAEAEGRLIPREAVELYIATFNTRFGDWCDQVPDIIAREAPAKFRKKIRERLQRELDGRRKALREELEAKARELDHRGRRANGSGSDGSEQ